MEIVFIPCDKSSFRVGRSPDNDYVLTEPFVSRHHFTVRRKYDGLVGRLHVTGSNGIKLNGELQSFGTTIYLREGDYITLCGKAFVFLGPAFNEGTFCQGRTLDVMLNTEPVEIEGPPPRKAPEKPSLVLAAGPALTMAIPILLGCGRTVAILSSIIAAIWAAGNVLARHGRLKKEEQKRKIVYGRYIEEKKLELQHRIEENRQYLLKEYPEAIRFVMRDNISGLLWRFCKDEDAFVRIGVGSAVPDFELNIPKDRLNLVDDSLKRLPGELKENFYRLEKAPIIVKFGDGAVIKFHLKKAGAAEEFNALLMQFAVNFAPDRMLIRFCDEDAKHLAQKYFGYIAFLPHYTQEETDNCFCRLYISSGEAISANVVKGILDAEGKRRNITLVIDKLEDDNTVSELHNRNFVSENTLGESHNMIPDRLSYAAAYALAVWLGKIWNRTNCVGYSLPEIIDFAELVGKEYVCYAGEPFDVTESISFPMGVDEKGEVICLDLHEKKDGPHGLIAGTTGSGKSELITTLILSAALRYSPEDICFFLIDYKGGGMANQFADLPHLAGSMTNLSAGDAQRAVISLSSENVRRQKLFKEAGVNNINDYIRLYRKGQCREALPHLIIVVDEFAELKKNQPEFMDSLISISQIGRSLGIHLILSTQKPAGVVDERIRSNTKFRIALRVEDKADSTDVLGIGDAADIALCGRAIIKKGKEREFVLFQSAYCMGYVNSNTERRDECEGVYEDTFCRKRIEKKQEMADDDAPCVSCIQNNGQIEDITWFEYYLDCIRHRCRDMHFKKVRPIWLSPLPGVISSEGNEYLVADDPYNHSYVNISYNPCEEGHLLAIGEYRTGTTDVLDALLHFISKSEDDKEIYIADFSGGMLKKYESLKCCGGVVTLDNASDADFMLRFIQDETKQRRLENDRSNLIGRLHHIYFVIANFGEFIRSCNDAAVSMLEDILKYGCSNCVFMAVSAIDASPGEIPSRIVERFGRVLILGNPEVYNTARLLKCAASEIPFVREIKGRGIMKYDGKILEFQAVCVPESASCEMGVKKNRMARAYPQIPDNPSVEELLKVAIAEHPPNPPDNRNSYRDIRNIIIPFGYIRENARVFYLPLGKVKCVIINGATKSKRNLLLDNISVILARYETQFFMSDSYEAFCSLTNSTIKKNNASDTDRKIILIRDLSSFFKDYYSKDRRPGDEERVSMFFDNSFSDRNNVTIIAATSDNIRYEYSTGKLYEALMKKPYGITLGGDVFSQKLFDYSYIPYGLRGQEMRSDIAVVKKYDLRMYYGEIIVPEEITGDVDNSQTRINRG